MPTPLDLSGLPGDVSRETIDKLESYAALLTQWQHHINLVAPSTLPHLWQRHFVDSLQLVPLLADKRSTIVDVGSGAGFPGLVLAIAGYTDVHLVESDQRKLAFLREAARVCGAKPSLHGARMENLFFPDVDVFTSRACGSIGKLLNILGPQCKKNTICLFHKGKNYTKELEEVRGWRFQVSVHASCVEKESVILELSQIVQGATA